MLISAVACARDGGIVWSHEDEVRLRMRDFSDEFLERYLAAAGDVVLQSVGAYQLESQGIQLFEEVDGDFFAVLGLPLLPLLGFLRECGELPR
jgi:septum formation protein